MPTFAATTMYVCTDAPFTRNSKNYWLRL
eukprot:COSAG02_NODE_32065_length_522_cov_314.553191_1_plen_28_part_10